MKGFLKRHRLALVFVVFAAILGARLTHLFFFSESKTALLPGTSTNGHYQIESQCHLCHTNEKKENVFTSSGVPNSACLACHGDDLNAFSDSHPIRKFKNPENAIFLEHIDAMSCIACHGEHNPKVTGDMAVTIPSDYCAHCHEVTLENLESHRNLGYETCATAGCHNYHDNMALAPSFLLKHYGEPDIMSPARTTPPDALARWLDEGNKKREPLNIDSADAPTEHADDSSINNDWSHSAHAAAGVNCSDCHNDPKTGSWQAQPDHRSCTTCHGFEVESFLKGKHGMRLAHKELSPMSPELARHPMKENAAHAGLTCNSCHEPHRYDRKFASHQACIKCHDDPHTRHYEQSAHFRLWSAELDGSGPEGSGVSCATCHMPVVRNNGHPAVDHDQTANLTPNEKMLRSVCMNCHGLQFSMDALADRKLIENNFNDISGTHHPGIDWTAESAIKRGDQEIIRLKAYLEANPGKSRDDLPPSEDTSNDDEP